MDEQKSNEYLKGYHDGYKEGCYEGLKIMMKEEQIRTNVTLAVKPICIGCKHKCFNEWIEEGCNHPFLSYESEE